MRKTKLELGRVVADRTYSWRRERSAGILKVRIGIPQRDPRPGGDWVCPIQLSGAPRGYGIPTAVRPVYGVDRLQALTLGLWYVRIILDRVAKPLSLTWLNSSDLGLPKFSE